ncbi:MAG: DUF5793 family protein [Haloarculaceae archaeon]
MRRDYVTLDVRYTDSDGEQLPTAVLTVEESTDLLGERLVAAAGDRLGADRIDVAFRLQTPVDDDEAAGVFSLSNRVTGEFVLEVNANAGPVLDLVEAARDGPDGRDARYRVVVRQDGEEVAVYEKGTLLVYDDDGNLLRQHSLIPSGVEL